MDPEAFNAFEKAGWAHNSADAYAEVFGPVTSRVIDDLLDAVAVGPGTRFLDVATGPGFVAARALARGARVVGTDLSPQMLALAAHNHPGLELVPGDAEDLPFGAGSFDAVAASFCMLHVGRPERAAASFARVLAPGGRAAFTVWSEPARCRLFGVIKEAVAAAGVSPPAGVPEGPDMFRFAVDAEAAALLTGAGLSDVVVRTLDFVHAVASADEVWRGFSEGSVRTRALLANQPEELRARIRAELADRLEPYRQGPQLMIPVSVKLASGRH